MRAGRQARTGDHRGGRGGGGGGGAVVYGVGGEEEVVGREVGVDAGGAEVFANALEGVGEGLGDATAELHGAGGPESEEGLDGRDCGGAGGGIGNEGDV